MQATGPAAAYRRSVTALVLLVLLGWATAVSAPEAAAAGQPVVTATTLQALPGTTATVKTAVSFAARVSPGDASGYVRFTGDGRVIASVTVVDGAATTAGIYLPVGSPQVVATFVPHDPSAFTPSASPPVGMTVTGVPNVWLTTASGDLVQGSAPVEPGRSYGVHVAGFPAGALVAVRVGATTLEPAIRADTTGEGALDLALPATFAPGVYTVDASAGEASAQVVFYVIPPAGATATAVASAGVPPQPSTAAATPSRAPAGAGGTLAHTGADPFGPGVLGLVLIGLGAWVVLWSRPVPARPYRPRH